MSGSHTSVSVEGVAGDLETPAGQVPGVCRADHNQAARGTQGPGEGCGAGRGGECRHPRHRHQLRTVYPCSQPHHTDSRVSRQPGRH